MIQIGVIGYGYWGPNIVRNIQSTPGARVATICDKDPETVKRALQLCPSAAVTTDPFAVTSSHEIDAVAVVTPVWTHFELAKAALLAGKHIFVEKPFTSTAAQAMELIELADTKQLKIMVDHTFLFTGAVRKIRQLLDAGELGKLFYYDSTRVNLGLFQHDVNVVWDLAPHDLAIMDYLLAAEPEALVASGQNHLNNHLDIAFLTIYFPGNAIGHINVNWLSPVKIRTTLIGGEKKMLVWNDLSVDEKVKIYDKGVVIHNRESVYDLLISYRSGDMWAPQLEQAEALKVEMNYFVECLETNTTPLNDGVAGLRIVRMLEAAEQSLKLRGAAVPVRKAMGAAAD
jgi:predicted dehydrogenase